MNITVDINSGVLKFIAIKELRFPPCRIHEVNTNTMINIPEGKILLITGDPNTIRRFGIQVCPSPIILSSDRGNNPLSIPMIWDGDPRSNYIDWHGYIKIPEVEEGICIARAVFIDIGLYTCDIYKK